MTIAAIRKNFHVLVDKVGDKETLSQFYKAFSFLAERKEGMLWDSLSPKEKKILMKSYEESKDKKNLLSHEKVMQKYSKWLSK